MQELQHIYNYIKNDSPFNAKKVRKAIIDETRKLLKFPEIGREVIKTPKDSIRQILVYKYRIFYRVLEQDVEIILFITAPHYLKIIQAYKVFSIYKTCFFTNLLT